MDEESNQEYLLNDFCAGIFDLFFNGYNPIKKYGQQLMNGWEVVRITIGNILVKGYRIFKSNKTHSCITFFKTDGLDTRYLYFQVAPHFVSTLTPNFLAGFSSAIAQINLLKQKSTHKYSAVICYALEKTYLELFGSEALEKNILSSRIPLNMNIILERLNQQGNQEQLQLIFQTFQPKIKKERELLQDSEDEFKKLKDVLYHYIDTFGQKYKTNYYKDMEKQCLTSYNITNLINTLNIIIYEETKPSRRVGPTGPMYSQIQSSVWTAFNRYKNQLESDRKDIVFSGTGRVLIIDIIFMKDLRKYIDSKQYREEVREVLEQYKNSHIEGRVKVIKVSNQLNTSSGFGLSYNIESAEIDSFTKLSQQ